MTNRLEGRRIIVTGAASGIGAAIARRFATEGAHLALFDRTPIAATSTSTPTTSAASATSISMLVDVADRASVDDAVARAVDALGGIDGVVNAAGIGVIAAFADTDEATWQNALDVNLSGPYRVCHAALEHLLAAGTAERAATIVNISSAAALQPLLKRSAYAASKGGLVSFTKVLAMELAPTVRANVLVPGAVDTPMVAGSFTGAALDAVVARYAMKRLGTADEIADAALFLTSDESAFVTGSTLSVDGGRIYH